MILELCHNIRTPVHIVFSIFGTYFLQVTKHCSVHFSDWCIDKHGNIYNVYVRVCACFSACISVFNSVCVCVCVYSSLLLTNV